MFLYFQVARFANESTATKAARKFSTPERKLHESTVRGWTKTFRKELHAKPSSEISESDMANNPRGRPLLLGDALDKQVQEMIRSIREAGGVINQTIVLSIARGIVSSHDRSLLKEHGGPIDLSRTWVESIMGRMNFVRRKGTKAAKKLPDNIEQEKVDFLARICEKVVEHNIPPELIINFDQTSVNIVPVSDWTLNLSGQKQVDIIGKDDKRAITALLGTSLTGDLLPTQVIYQGSSKRCHPKFNFPKEWDITHTPTHWSNTETMIQYMDNIANPYFKKVKADLGLPPQQKSLIICDVFKAHRTTEFKEKVVESGCELEYVPANCTSEFQPLDVSGNKEFKGDLKGSFQGHYADQVSKGLAEGLTPADIKVDLQLGTLKPLHAKWVLHAAEALRQNKSVLLAGWKMSGIADAVYDAISNAAAAADADPEPESQCTKL